jgi:uroporphyrin-III C-methyltransferase/precorrin-2 dehydrogenase/sirohydrochlorin ferrochelatase
MAAAACWWARATLRSTRSAACSSRRRQLRVIAPKRARNQATGREGKLEWIQRRFEPADLDGNFLVIAATDARSERRRLSGCVERNIPCNSVDDIPNCDFFFGSVVSRGDLQIAISTSGESPAVAQRLRREIDAQLPEDLGPGLRILANSAAKFLKRIPAARPASFCCISSPSAKSASPHPALRAKWPLAPSRRKARHRLLVGAGPGDPDLLTVKALRLIQSADVILHDDLVPQAILDLASPTPRSSTWASAAAQRPSRRTRSTRS